MGIASPAIELDEDKPQDRFEVDVIIQDQPKKLSVNVLKNDLYLSMDRIMLDFWDVDESTDNPFMHMFMDADRAVDTDEKLQRMNVWASAITGYDSIMATEAGQTYGRVTLINMLKAGQIPKPVNIVLRGGSPGLRRLYQNLAFAPNPQNVNEFIVPWDRLRDLAQSGEFVNAWKRLKGIQ